MNTLAERLYKLILKEKNLYRLKTMYMDNLILFIRSDDEKEKKVLYKFWNKLDLRILFEDIEHSLRYLIDLNLDLNKKEVYISYQLWRIINSNVVREKRSISYDQFKNIIRKDELLIEELEKIESEWTKKPPLYTTQAPTIWNQ